MPFQFRHCWTFDKNVLPDLHLEALLHHLELNCLEGMNDHLQWEGQGEKREKKKAVFALHWMYLHPSSLTSSAAMRARKAGETLFPAELGVRNSTWQPGERLQKMQNFWLKYFFTPCLQSFQKGQVRLAHLVTYHQIYVCTLLIPDAPYTVAQSTVLMNLTVYIQAKL